MKWFHWLGVIMIIGAVFVWLATYAAHAQAQPSPEQLKTFWVEWHIRAYISKDRHPLTFSDYSGETFKTAKDCLARLAKPDEKLKQTHAGFTTAVHEKIGKDVAIDWTCVVFLTPPAGRDV